MHAGRPLKPITLFTLMRKELEALAHSSPRGLGQRARIILLAADGLSNIRIAQNLGLSAHTVGLWRRRYLEKGIAGLYDEPKPGGPRSINDEKVASLIRKILYTPKDGFKWTIRSLAKKIKLSVPTVARICQAYGLKLPRQKKFTIFADPFFAGTVLDIVGLYLSPPDMAMALCTAPKLGQFKVIDGLLQVRIGYVEGRANYMGNGTPTLFTALDIALGQTLPRSNTHQRHLEFLNFIKRINANVPDDLDIHLVVENYSPRKYVKPWLADHHLHHAHDYASWLNQVENWFNILTQKAIRRGTFRSVKEFAAKIDNFVSRYDPKSQPFIWIATDGSIREKLQRILTQIALPRSG